MVLNGAKQGKSCCQTKVKAFPTVTLLFSLFPSWICYLQRAASLSMWNHKEADSHWKLMTFCMEKEMLKENWKIN